MDEIRDAAEFGSDVRVGLDILETFSKGWSSKAFAGLKNNKRGLVRFCEQLKDRDPKTAACFAAAVNQDPKNDYRVIQSAEYARMLLEIARGQTYQHSDLREPDNRIFVCDDTIPVAKVFDLVSRVGGYYPFRTEDIEDVLTGIEQGTKEAMSIAKVRLAEEGKTLEENEDFLDEYSSHQMLRSPASLILSLLLQSGEKLLNSNEVLIFTQQRAQRPRDVHLWSYPCIRTGSTIDRPEIGLTRADEQLTDSMKFYSIRIHGILP